jgi:HPt (histidine-containing phosphotransfer) domain-containing protein
MAGTLPLARWRRFHATGVCVADCAGTVAGRGVGRTGTDVNREQEIIDELWREVRPSQLELVQELADDAARVREDRDLEAWLRVRSVTHRLAGTLGSFGQQPAGETAVALDRIVTGVDHPDEQLVERASALIAALQEELTAGRGDRALG